MVTFSLNAAALQASTSLALASGLTSMTGLPLAAQDDSTLLPLEVEPDSYTGGEPVRLTTIEAGASHQSGAAPQVSEEVVPAADLAADEVATAAVDNRVGARPAAAMAAGLATLLMAAPALADTGVSASVGINPNIVQIIALLILYGIPITRGVIRAVRSLVGGASQAPGTNETGPINNLTGQLEYTFGPARNTFVKLAVLGSLILDPYRSLLGYLPPLVALGLSWFSNRSRSQVVNQLTDRAAEVVDQHKGDEHKVKGLRRKAWYRHFKRGLGIRGPDAARTFQEEELFRANVEMNAVARPQRSLWRNLLAFRETLRFTGHLGDQASRGQGFWRTVREKANVFFRGRVAPATPESIKRGDVLGRQWGINMTEAEQVRQVELVGAERVAGKRCIFAGINHSGWEDYAAALMLTDPTTGEALGIRPGADKYNFHDFYLLRLTSLPYAFDKLGLPYFMRRGKLTIGQRIFGQRYDWVQDMSDKMDAGIQPLIFVKGSRDTRTYLENGDLDEPGLYDVVQKRYSKYPERYMAIGIADQAVRVAEQSGQPIDIAIMRMPKGHRISPKVGSKPPLLQATLTGQTKQIEIADTIEVRPGMTTDEVFELLQKRSREVTGIDALLAQRTQEWATQLGHDAGLSEVFADRASDDVRWAILADRIRSIPPRSQNRKAGAAREEHQETFLNLLESPPDEERLHRALAAVSRTAKKHQYDPWYMRIYDLGRGLLGIPRQRYTG